MIYKNNIVTLGQGPRALERTEYHLGGLEVTMYCG